MSGTDERCGPHCFSPETVTRLRPLHADAADVAALFKALADETRVKIAHALLQEELCVHDVAALLGVSVATASHHLRLLRQSGLARSRKEGKFVFYSLDDDHVRNIVAQAVDHALERRPVSQLAGNDTGTVAALHDTDDRSAEAAR